VFVFPKYEQICKDFHVPLPPITRYTRDVMNAIGPPLAILIGIVALAFLGRAIWEVFRKPTAGPRPDLAIGHWLMSTLPPTRNVVRYRDLADTFQLLADAADSGLPAPAALDEASRLFTAPAFHKKITRWTTAVHAGVPLPDAARQAAMPPIVVGMLSTAQVSTNLPDVSRFLARYYRQKFSRATAFLRAAAVPAMVLFFAVPVLCIALSLFLPLLSMIAVVNLPLKVHL
jgi:type II secretory pathway component PulF